MNDLFTGITCGIVQVIVGHPLDTIKTLSQNNINWKKLNFKNYYRGAKYQLPYSITKNGIIFPSYTFAKRYTNSDFTAGLFSGLMATPTQYIFDVAKIKRQTNKKLDLKTFIENKGKIAVLNREVLAMGIYFKSYKYFKEKNYNSSISGGISGFLTWLITYPFDVIRSRQISQNIKMIHAIKFGNLYKGLTPCLIRSIITNSAVWTVYEITQKKLKLN